ncbi:uncharacterized protein FFB14_06349 [Fusarium fujikuroi]|nr:uncharacterized protein FFB14_06349 [Fusarium fujikuroi]
MSDVHIAITKSDALKALCEQFTLEISEIKSPEREYRERRQALLGNCDNELLQLGQYSPDTDEHARRRQAIIQQAGDLRELEIQYQSSVALLERQFGQRLEAANKRLACDLFQTLGDTLWDYSVSTVLNECIRPKDPIIEVGGAEEGFIAVLEAQNDPNTEPDITMEGPIDLEDGQSQGSRPTGGNSEDENHALVQASALTEARASLPGETLDQPLAALRQTSPAQERDTASQPNLVTDGQGATSPTATSQTPTQQPVLSSERAGSQKNTSPDQPPVNSLVVHLRAPLKRLQAEASNRKQKRQKLPIERPSIPEERVIAFDQVFQDGKAQKKYIIVQHPPEFGHWYILECKEHNKHFHKDPIRGASRHLVGKKHGLNGEHSLAVKMLGTRVLHCNEKLAAKNNKITRESYPQAMSATTQCTTPGNRILPSKEDLLRDIEVIPIVGEIYAAKFPKQSHTYPILVLPWKAFDHFPYMKQLLRNTPACYLFDKAVDQYPRGWAKDYEDGGRKFKDRDYPVVYFHREKFPEQCDVGWVRITSFKIYDPGHTGVVCSKIVDRYIQNKDPRLAATHHSSTDHSVVISDDDGGETRRGESMERGNGELSCDASRKQGGTHPKREQLGRSTQVQMEHRAVDPRSLYTTASQSDATHASHSQICTQEPSTMAGPMARIEYPFVSGGSEDVGNAVTGTTSQVATSASQQPIVNVVQLGEVHTEGSYSRPVPQNVDIHSRSSLRPQRGEDTDVMAAGSREAMLALGPDIGSHVRWCDEVLQEA